MLTAYRHAAWDTPWRVNLNRRPGRFNGPMTDSPTQYLCLHPLGPSAEWLRANWSGSPAPSDLAEVRLSLWACLVSETGLLRVDFSTARTHGIDPDDLVGDDYASTQAWADDLRANGVPGIIVPSAALPGTMNLVLFGPRVLHPYLIDPISSAEVPTGHISADVRPAAEVVPSVRAFGDVHEALEAWQRTGRSPVFAEPSV